MIPSMEAHPDRGGRVEYPGRTDTVASRRSVQSSIAILPVHVAQLPPNIAMATRMRSRPKSVSRRRVGRRIGRQTRSRIDHGRRAVKSRRPQALCGSMRRTSRFGASRRGRGPRFAPGRSLAPGKGAIGRAGVCSGRSAAPRASRTRCRFTSNSQTAKGGIPTQSQRAWTSPVADLDFRDAGDGRVEIASVHGTGGVTVTSESRRGNAAPAHARMTSDEMIGTFGPDSTLSAMTGSGHAMLDQTTESGARQTTSGDRVEAHFSAGPPPIRPRRRKAPPVPPSRSTRRRSSAMLFSSSRLLRRRANLQPFLRATAQRADYDGTGEWLHLAGSPHVENGEIALDADKVDVARVSGDAFAHGSVKASWFGNQSSGLGGRDRHM